MATTKDTKRLPSGRISYRGETFAGFNKPKKTPNKSKKSAVLAKKGSEVKLVRFGDPKMFLFGGRGSSAFRWTKITFVFRHHFLEKLNPPFGWPCVFKRPAHRCPAGVS